MRAKICFPLLFLLLIHCSSPKMEETAAEHDAITSPDTVSRAVGYQSQETETSTAVTETDNEATAWVGNFPEFSEILYSKDGREAASTTAVVALLKEYRHKKFYRIQRQYEWFLPDQPDSGTRERWTWYYNMDSTASLKACVYENVSLHDVRETYIFLIDYDAVDVAHMDYALSGPDPLIRRQRAILKECPDCGVILSNKNDEGYKVEVLNSDDFTEIRRTYTAKLYDVMYAILKSAAVTRIDAEHYLLEEQEAYFETGYTITTTIDRIPYEKYKAKIAEQEL